MHFPAKLQSFCRAFSNIQHGEFYEILDVTLINIIELKRTSQLRKKPSIEILLPKHAFLKILIYTNKY
ncbi:hypothetical protein BpHYR1_000139 [Brachionus plicatilis]|uniref:Uncharacterized protein n=1 Tax=Brachionus plicatilis TaxID=10195 RepID=A0A3M7SCS8_BRAPC|nr:hypothetical protein BpHYR1_000139 [Brachionus plicatilis]